MTADATSPPVDWKNTVDDDCAQHRESSQSRFSGSSS